MTTSFIVSLIVQVLLVVGVIQIITKAGYSPWWIVVPLSIPALWIIAWAVAYSDFPFPVVTGWLGGFTFLALGGLSGTLRTLIDLIQVDVVLNFVLFLVFAFSDWPVMKAARAHIPVITRDGVVHRATRSSPGGPGGTPQAAVVRPPADATGQPEGWYATGTVGSGEQSHWDGSAWTARRVWRKESWTDLPLEEPAAPETLP
jgi:hypothetical protein